MMASPAGSVDEEKCNNCSHKVTLFFIVAPCNHRLCMNCISNQRTTLMKCDTCRSNSDMQCMNMNNGCSTLFKRQSDINLLQKHPKICGYRLIPCPNSCSPKILSKALVRHISNDCPNRSVECEYCKGNFYFKEMQDHRGVCKEFPGKCEFCGSVVVRKSADDHLRDCSHAVRNCDLCIFGCNFRGTRDELHDHVQLNSHAKLFSEYVSKSEEKMQLLLHENECLNLEVKILRDKQKKSDDKIKEFIDDILALENKNTILTDELSLAKSELQRLKTELSTLKSDLLDNEKILKALEAQLEVLENSVRIMKDQDAKQTKEMLAYVDRNAVACMCDEVEMSRRKARVAEKVDTMFLCFDMFRDSIEVLKQIADMNDVSYCPSDRYYSDTEYFHPYPVLQFKTLSKVKSLTVVWFTRLFIHIPFFGKSSEVWIKFVVENGNLSLYAFVMPTSYSKHRLTISVKGSGPPLELQKNLEGDNFNRNEDSLWMHCGDMPLNEVNERCTSGRFWYSVRIEPM